MTIRVQVSCWCWNQAREIRDTLPQFTPTIEDWWPEPSAEYDILDLIMAQNAEPMIHIFFDVETNQDVDQVIVIATGNEQELALCDRTFRPTIHVEGDD